MSAYADPVVGSATRSFTRNFESSQLLSSGLYSEAAHNTAAYQWNVANGRTVYKSTLEVIGLLPAGSSRDLTVASWSISSGTRAKTQTGIKGDANACTLFTATSDNATLTNARIASSSVRTLTAFIKRVSGTGGIDITLDGGTTWTPLTVPSDAAFHRVEATQTLANPTYGFRLATSGDSIAIDAVSDVALSHAIDTFITRSDQRTSTLTYTFGTPFLEPSRRYKATVKSRFYRDIGMALGQSAVNNVRLLSVANNPESFNVASWSSSAAQNNSTAIQSGATVVEKEIGDEVGLTLRWGRGKMQYDMDGVLQNTVDTVGKLDPTVIDRAVFAGNGDYWDFEIAEIRGTTLNLFGDSITASSNYTKRFFFDLDQDTYDPFRRGQGGDRIDDLIDRVDTDVTPTFNTRALRNVVLLWVGSNTLADNVSGADSLIELATLIADIKAGGDWEVVCLTTLPRGAGFTGTDAAGFATQAAIYNAGLRAAGADRVIDLSVVSETADYSNLTYYSDAIHPTDALYELLWPVILSQGIDPPASAPTYSGEGVSLNESTGQVNTDIDNWDDDGSELTFNVLVYRNGVYQTTITEYSNQDVRQYGYGNYYVTVVGVNEVGESDPETSNTVSHQYIVPELPTADRLIFDSPEYTETTNAYAIFQDEYFGDIVAVSSQESIKSYNIRKNPRDLSYLTDKFRKRSLE